MKKLGRLSPQSTVFMFCDIQEVFQPLIYKMDALIASAAVLTQASTVMQIPLIVTEQSPKVFGKTISELSKHFKKDQTVFDKTQFSMLVDSVKQKNDLAGKSVVLFGIEAHVCIQQTSLELLELGCDVHVVKDAVSSQNAEDRETALERMRDSGVFITSTESVIFELLRDSKDANFKPMLPLIKVKRERM